MFNFLKGNVDKLVKKIEKTNLMSEENINDVLNETQRILIEADVNIKVAKRFTNSIKDKLVGKEVSVGLTPSKEFMKIFHKELIKILSGGSQELRLHGNPSVMMVVGLQGTGKTTSISKITNFLVNKKHKFKKPLLVAGDIYRPAAIDQLQKLGKDLGVDVFSMGTKTNPRDIAKAALKKAESESYDLVIMDTAGRLQIDDSLMKELVDLKKILKPSEIIYVLDAMSGQEVINVVKEFDKKLSLTGTFISKLDSDARGGTALSVASMLSIPAKFIGTGEKPSDIELFHPDRMANRILGLGDVATLFEKVEEISDEKKNERMMRRMMSGQFDLDDLMDNLNQISKMGKMSSVLSMIPGAGKLVNGDMDQISEKIKVFRVLLSSMTLEERKNPKLLNHPNRKKRILAGSGKTIQEYNTLIRQFEKSKKQMKLVAQQLKSGRMPNFRTK